METFMTWAKENMDLINLFFAMLGVIIAIVALVYEMKKKKEKEKGEGANKED